MPAFGMHTLHTLLIKNNSISLKRFFFTSERASILEASNRASVMENSVQRIPISSITSNLKMCLHIY